MNLLSDSFQRLMKLTSTTFNSQILENYIDRIMESISIARDNHITAKTIQTCNVNRSRRSDPIYKVEDMVMLNSKNIHRRITKNGHSVKLYPRFLGSFKIIKVESRTSNYTVRIITQDRFHLNPSELPRQSIAIVYSK